MLQNTVTVAISFIVRVFKQLSFIMEFRDFKKLIREYVDDHYENFGFYPYEVEIDGQVYSYGGYWAILDDDRFD